MSDLSVIIKISSANQQFTVANELILIKADSSTTCYDIIASLSQKSPLLQHILTFIRHYSEHKNNDNDNKMDIDTHYMEIIAFKEESQELTNNIPINKSIYPLLSRHKWKLLQFLISDHLMMQSQVFLSHINGKQHPQNAPNSANFPSFSKRNRPSNIKSNEGTKKKEFCYRRFFNRFSPITARELANMAEITSLYHICFAILIVFLTGILTNEALEKGVLYNFELLSWNFGQSDKVFLIWCAMFMYSFLFVTLFHQYRLRSVDRLNFGSFYFCLIAPLIYIPFQLIRYLDLPVASATIIACEQMRFIMKIHAYMFEMFRALHYGEIFHTHLSPVTAVKENKYKYLEQDWIDAWNQCMEVSQIKAMALPQHPGVDDSFSVSGWIAPKSYSPIPTQRENYSNVPIVVEIAHYPYHQHVQSFLSFLFCPSLVYRWSYPTVKKNVNGDIDYKINWTNIFHQLVNMGGCLLFVFVVFYVFICPSFVNTPYEPFTFSAFLSLVFSSAIPGMLLVVMCFLGVIHCWLNTWSELTGYCDRVFYEDWWNAKSFASYSKKWNLVVFNWSYNYFFLPMLEAGYSKSIADLFTFWLWAAIQEYVFFAVSGCFYPVLLVSCIIYGVLFYSVPFTDSTSLRYYLEPNALDTEQSEINNVGTSKSGVWNVSLWIMLFLQNGFFVTLYAREWYAATAYSNGKIVLNDDSYLPYSWQTAFYPNGSRVCD